MSELSISKNADKPFILLEEDRSVIPVFDLNRRLGNVFAQFRYRHLVEKEFTVDGFLNGAIQVIAVGSIIVHFHKNWFGRRNFLFSSFCEFFSNYKLYFQSKKKKF